MKAKILLVMMLIGAMMVAGQQLEPEIAQYYGDATGAPDGTIITVESDGNTFTVETDNQRYGYDPIFYVNGTDGEPVEFYIGTDLVGDTIFENFAVERIDLTMPGVVPLTLNCTDGVYDPNFETDTDCGDQCPPCPRGDNCQFDSDCDSGNCVNGQCVYPKHCYNGNLDPNETDIDCGGECARCDNGEECDRNSDCRSGYCANGVCKNRPQPRGGGGGGGGGTSWRRFYDVEEEITPTPGAGIMCNGTWQCGEWGDCQQEGYRYRDCVWVSEDPTVQCGLRPAAPAMAEQCRYVPERIVEATCFDGIQNQGELGIDCGGPCAPCYVEEMPQPREVNWLLWASIPFFLLILGLVAWLILKPAEIKDTKTYIKEAKRRGYSKQEIADRLRESGYTDEQVQEAFRKAR